MSTYGKLTVPTADVFKSQNNIASIDDNGKIPLSQLPDDLLTSTSLKNSDLTVKSLNIATEYGNGVIQNKDTYLDISEDASGVRLRSIYSNQDTAEITLALQEERLNKGNIYIKSNTTSGYGTQPEINIVSSDGNLIALGDNKLKFRFSKYA